MPFSFVVDIKDATASLPMVSYVTLLSFEIECLQALLLFVHTYSLVASFLTNKCHTLDCQLSKIT